jgi:hypothetical protein
LAAIAHFHLFGRFSSEIAHGAALGKASYAHETIFLLRNAIFSVVSPPPLAILPLRVRFGFFFA